MNRTAEPYLRVTELANAFAISRMLHVALSLDLFTRLANQDKTAAQLASLADVDAHALEVLLDALTAEGFLQKHNGRYFDTPTSQTYLSREGPKYLGHSIRSIARQWDTWGKLENAIRRGRPVGRHFESAGDPDAIEDAVRGQHEQAMASGDARYLSKAIPLRKCRKLLHLGGGCGTYASMFCRANRSLQATVLDLPARLKTTRKILRKFDTTKRVSTLSGDARTPGKVRGAPFDVVLITDLLQNEDAATNAAILEKAHDALVPGGLLIVKEHILSADHTQPLHAALLSLELLLTSAGRAWSFAEMSPWLEGAGFVDAVEVPMEPPIAASLVLALRSGQPAVAVLPRPAAKVEAAAGDVPAGDGTGKPAALAQPAPRKASSPRTRNASSPSRRKPATTSKASSSEARRSSSASRAGTSRKSRSS